MQLRYYAQIDDEAAPFLVEDDEAGLQVRPVDAEGEPGAALAADFSLVQAPGVYSLLLNGTSYEVYVEPDSAQEHTWLVTLGRFRFVVQVQTERERRLAKVAGHKAAHTGEVTVKAPMPGLVREVAVRPGDSVADGQRLVVLEAMKMENDIQAPRAGQVRSVHVKAGETVDSGRALVVLE